MAYPINPIGLINVVLNYEPWDDFSGTRCGSSGVAEEFVAAGALGIYEAGRINSNKRI
jgi:hypothetical protein